MISNDTTSTTIRVAAIIWFLSLENIGDIWDVEFTGIDADDVIDDVMVDVVADVDTTKGSRVTVVTGVATAKTE